MTPNKPCKHPWHKHPWNEHSTAPTDCPDCGEDMAPYIEHTGISKGDWLMFVGGGAIVIGEVVHIEWWGNERDQARFYTTAGVADKILRVRKGPDFDYKEETRK